MHIKVTSFRHIEGYILEITFESGEKGTVDFSDYTKRGDIFRSFSDLEYFKRVSIDPDWGVLCWPGDVDIAPETVYRLAMEKESV